MAKKRKTHQPSFKARVAFEACKEQQTTGEIASRFQVHPTQIAAWKKRLKEGASSLFERQQGSELKEYQERESQLYAEIGRLKMELEWLQKKMESFD